MGPYTILAIITVALVAVGGYTWFVANMKRG
jgi:hypothetical protein